MAVTISDVAKKAGVSTSTVSKVLNHWTTISDATCKKVEAAITELQYTPNATAVSFAKKNTHNIVYLTSLEKGGAYHNPHMFDIMCGVQSELAKRQYSLTLIDTSLDSYPGESVAKVISRKNADGLIIHGSAISKEETVSIIQKEQFPHIIIGHPGFDSTLCWIDTNHGLAGQYAAKHMIACGYTKTAFIGGRKTDYISCQRLKGFLGTMHEFGYTVPAEYIGYTGSTMAESCEFTLKLMALPSDKRPQAIICENNTIALGVAKALRRLQLSVPAEIAFLTFDSYPYSEIIEPSPTIVDIDVYDMGVQAGNLMLRKLENPTLLVQSYTTLPVIIQGKTTCGE